MGLTSSSSSEEEHWEQPSEKHEATLYYFAGRGLADQLRWLLAAGNTSFTQKIISQRMHFERMARRQLPFGQLPLLQIDGLELVQCQACLRYLARRAHIAGRTPEEVLKCDMIAEAIRDLLALLTTAPFKRTAATPPPPPPPTPDTSSSSSSNVRSAEELKAAQEEWKSHLQTMRERFDFVAGRFEAVLAANLRHRPSSSSSSTATATTPSSVHPIADIAAYNALPGQVFLVGKGLTYADVLAAHLTTWFVEECGPDLLKDKPLLVQLQNQVHPPPPPPPPPAITVAV
eukprot:scaffold3296_cov159-Ochromonas_danica.AAC.10